MKSIILIDFDGVIRQWPGDEVTQAEQALGVTPGSLYKAAFTNDLLNLAVCGEISHQEWCDRVTTQLARCWSQKTAEELVDTWQQAKWQIDTELVAGLRHHAPESKLVLVTNGTSQLEADLASANLLDSFDLVVSSAHIGVAKPDRLYFEVALQLAEGHPVHAVFIDDSHTNVATAKAMGIDSLVHTNKDETLAFVRSHFS
ncbi:HAD family hydrolase [Vibrio sinaloensis]|uniref:HAD family hydrolase n=1 Tax=Photobacterium sp. (strain ATCC 43367) TaxID=379097 RepID=UPI000C1C921D|nr:HAD-IA family hydrolase [Vibrio sinaloensis]